MSRHFLVTMPSMVVFQDGGGERGTSENMKLDIQNRFSNGAASVIDASAPYTVQVEIEGIADILFHRWNNEAVEAKASAAKNSKAKKTDDVESYVYRMVDGDHKSHLAIPGEYFRRALCEAGRYKQDPRSPRKSMLDMCKAGLVIEEPLSSLKTKDWDYIHKARVVIQRSAITRSRPAMHKGWRVSFSVTVLTPEYIHEDCLNSLTVDAGRLIGLADFRPSYGRFKIVKWQLVKQN